MRFMLMMHAPRGTGDYQASQWSPEDFKAHIAFMHRFNQDLTEAGELVGAEGLAPPGQARIVRAGKGGVPAVTDGPFPRPRSSSPDTGSSRWTARARRRARGQGVGGTRDQAASRSAFRSRCVRSWRVRRIGTDDRKAATAGGRARQRRWDGSRRRGTDARRGWFPLARTRRAVTLK